MIRIGTRASVLARTQSQMIADALGAPAELVFISTEGDVNPAPLERIGGTGVFVSAVRDALLDGRVDLVVHSMKDLPTAPAPGITLVAVPPREDPRDVLCARDGLALSELPQGARVGTGSARRAAQLLAARPDLEITGLRGNIDTRLSKIGELDAVVLAAAGLSRAGRAEQVTEYLDPEVMLPAAAQGALAIECRSDDLDSVAARLAAGMDDPTTRARTVAERAFLSRLEAGCTAPVGALAEVTAGELHLRGLAISRDGVVRFAGQRVGDFGDAAEVGAQLAEQLLDDGAGVVLTRG
ncbi:hydroxymethylbilane synthase [Propionibacteriaceae bacterium Y1923]